ncbi:MAG: D-alanyl-D-alanine carboxypeptidase [Deltaproteobacteria bacterium]|nr:D-alanyl-D-alanine carboxypeptidase [Deltaproteobacteria bacterium]
MRKKRFTNYLLVTALFLLPAVAVGKGAELEERLKGLLPEGAEWSMSVMDINTNSFIYDAKSGSRAAESASGLTPASLVKLFTSGASLEHANKIDMTTYISRDAKLKNTVLNGNLYLTGRGNALLSEADLRNAVKDMLKSGIKTVNGSIVADDTLFNPIGLDRTRKGPAYAPPSALGLDLHTIAVHVAPSKAGEPPAAKKHLSFILMRSIIMDTVYTNKATGFCV